MVGPTDPSMSMPLFSPRSRTLVFGEELQELQESSRVALSGGSSPRTPCIALSALRRVG